MAVTQATYIIFKGTQPKGLFNDQIESLAELAQTIAGAFGGQIGVELSTADNKIVTITFVFGDGIQVPEKDIADLEHLIVSAFRDREYQLARMNEYDLDSYVVMRNGWKVATTKTV